MNGSVDKPRILFTMGDINGIGPEILAKALAQTDVWDACRPVIAGSVATYEDSRRFAPDAPEGVAVDSLAEAMALDGAVGILEFGVSGPSIQPGVLDAEAGRAAHEWIVAATTLVMAGEADAIVTGPIHKEGFQTAGVKFRGHTDLIANLTGVSAYRMCLFAGNMRVVHLTGHRSLRDAIDAITPERIVESVEIGRDALVRVGIDAPRIAVAGLNPHAGEAGAFGREEIEIIAPAIEECRARGMDCTGPHPPDAIFRWMREDRYDMVIAMYHDQGHIPMKLIAMDEGVNVTLGLPIIRTSVDHGVAYDIAGRGIAREDSLLCAINLAVEFASRKNVSRACSCATS